MEERRLLKKKALDSKSPSLRERAVVHHREKYKQVKTSARKLCAYLQTFEAALFLEKEEGKRKKAV